MKLVCQSKCYVLWLQTACSTVPDKGQPGVKYTSIVI